MTEFDDIARDLYAMRAAPRPEYAGALDQRAAAWLREQPRRRLPSLRIAIPAAATAAAAAAVAVALVVSGGDGGDGRDGATRLDVAVVPDQAQPEALGGGTELQRDSAAAAPAEGTFAAPEQTELDEGAPVKIRYFFTAGTEGTVELGGREAQLRVGPGAGHVEISTEGLSPGGYRLEIAFPSMPRYRERIKIRG